MDIFYALAEPRRRKIVELLALKGELSATEICGRFDITAQAVSQHLRVLLESGLLVMERRAQRRIYSINAASISEVEEWAHRIESMWNDRFDLLESVLESEMKGMKKR